MKDLKKNLLACFLTLFLSLTSYAQFFEIKEGVSLKTVKQVATSKVVIDGQELGVVVVEGKESEPQTFPLKAIKVVQAEGYGPTNIEIQDSKGDYVDDVFKDLDGSEEYKVGVKPGIYRITGEAVNKTTSKITKQRATVQIGTPPEPTPPGPDPNPPGPDVPDTEISVKVRDLTAFLTRNQQVSELFRSMAQRMKDKQIITQVDADRILYNEFKRFLPEYQPLEAYLKEQSKIRVKSFDKTIEYYEAISKGLK